MLPPEYEQQLRQLLRVFLGENQKLNLSAFRTEETCWIGNILDSLAFLDIWSVMVSACLPARQGDEPSPRTTIVSPFVSAQGDTMPSSILDLGTGGGFPLLPLAICLPQHHFTGIDATRKKVHAVQRMIDTLDLPHVALFWGRAATLGKDPAHHQKYDIILSRAVAKLPELLQLSLPFLKPGGFAVFWKSVHIDDELRLSEPIQKKVGCSLVATHRYALPGDFGERQLLIFQKTPRALHCSP